MTFPFTMAKRAVRSSVIEVTTNALGEISGPLCSLAPACGSATCAAGFQPMGQNGLRMLLSTLNVDLFFSSITGEPAGVFGFAGALALAGALPFAGVLALAGAGALAGGRAASAANKSPVSL